MWWAAKKRWMTQREKQLSLGMPVCADVAGMMNVPELPIFQGTRGNAISGNSMHFSTVAIVQLVALISFQSLDVQ